MKLWIDDIRPAPNDYLWCKSVNEAKDCIEYFEELIDELRYQLTIRYSHHEERQNHRINEIQNQIKQATITLIDLDYDAGDYANDGGDYVRLLDWFEETGRNYPIRIHSMNPVGVQNMRAIIQKNSWQEIEQEVMTI